MPVTSSAATLAFVAGASERALIIGVPDDVDNSHGMVNVIPLGGGTPRSWVPGVGGVPSGGASRFGGALASVNGGTTITASSAPEGQALPLRQATQRGFAMSMRRIRASLIALAVILVAPLYWSGQPAHAAAEGCDPGLESDFNNDGRSDTVVADPYATVDGQAQAGRVIVLYGDADGRIGEGARGTITQGADFIGGIPDANDRFGSALAAADIDCDGYTDLVVGTPYEDINGQADSGYVQIIWGSGAGLGEGTDLAQPHPVKLRQPRRRGRSVRLCR